MLTPTSVEQALMVLSRISAANRAGLPVLQACHRAISETSKHYGKTYQTIEDLIRRRLGLERIDDFHALIEKWMEGQPAELRDLLLSHSDPAMRANVRDFFETGGAVEMVREFGGPSASRPQTLEQFTFSLDRETAKKLRVLALMDDSDGTSGWLSNAIPKLIDDRYREFLLESTTQNGSFRKTASQDEHK